VGSTGCRDEKAERATMNAANMQAVVSVDEMRGEDAEETEILRQMLAEATSYICGFDWCNDVVDAYYGLGVGGVVAVFLLRIDGAPGVDEWLWVVVGDIPSAYLMTDKAPDGVSALRVYCDLMSEWVNAVRAGTSLDAVVPVDAIPNAANANALARRIVTLQEHILPAFVD
jgi:hypothetical protein